MRRLHPPNRFALRVVGLAGVATPGPPSRPRSFIPMNTHSRHPSRSRIASVRFNPLDYRRLSAAAIDRGISLSEMIRRASLGLALPEQRTPQIDAQTLLELRRIGVNLNQGIAHFHRWAKSTAIEKQVTWVNWKMSLVALVCRLDDLARRLR